MGIAMAMEDQVGDSLKSGALVALLDDWRRPFAGYHLYYPDRHQLSSAFRHFVDGVRYRH
jgi:DNA-binding transcriptional LysR family regulator